MATDERDDVTENEDELDDVEDPGVRGLPFVAGFVLGALLGAGTALLLAPDRGDVTRRRLRRQFRHLRDDASDRVGEIRSSAERELRRRRRKLRKLVRR